MAYDGYRIKMSGTIVPDTLIQKGSYSYVNNYRLVRQWQDANGNDHFDYFKRKKAKITFDIRERSLSEHIDIKSIFTKQTDISVTYWDDYSCEYKNGTFKMKEPTIQHINAANGIFYAQTKIELEEY